MSEIATNGPQKYGEYEVESVLGRGAMGMVYLARDRRIGRRVALKTVQVEQKFEDESDATEFFRRLQREAEVCGAMQHPNIVTLYEPGYENNVISFLATEYVQGESLRDRLKRSKPLPLDDALRIGEDTLRGLAYAHAKGVIHRDIKPANILLASDGQAKIADFGIARPVNSDLTAVGSMLGTPNYMSPEQVKCADVTTKSDLFSVGVVLYEMLTGVKPFTASDVSGILRNVVDRDPPPANDVNADVPEPIGKFVAHLFAKRPEARFGSAAEALEQLEKLRRDVPLGTVESLKPDVPETDVTPGSSSKPIDGTTDRGRGDVTPGLASLTMGRNVPPPIFWSVLAALIIPLAAAVAIIHASTDPRPTATIEAAKLAEFNAKRRTLLMAKSLRAAGREDEAIKMYDGYLKRYPKSITAQTARANAVAELQARQARSSVTTRATKPGPKPDEQKKPDNLWQRIFRRGKTNTNKTNTSKTNTKK
jgi:serine/threonine protein kinase